MTRCCLCRSLGASHNDHDKSRLELLLDHAAIHESQVNRNAKANIPDILKIFAGCFPKTASKYTVREMVDSIEPARNGGRNDGMKEKTATVSTKSIKKVPQRQDTTLVNDTEKRSPIHKQGKHSSLQPSKISIHTQCRNILEASCDKNQQCFQCGACDDRVLLQSGRKDGFHTWRAVGHVVLHHMDIKPFRCRYCDHRAKSPSSISCHVKRAHQAPGHHSIHYINELNAHKTEICEMVAACFGKKQWKVNKNESQKKIEVTKQYGDTTLAAGSGNQQAANVTHDRKKRCPHGTSVIGAHCRRTMAPYSIEQRRFECGLCGTLIALRTGPKAVLNLIAALQHAVAHMNIKPFRCRYCAAATKTQSSMCMHVKKVHKLASSSSIHYINETSVHEKEICEVITMCFGKKDQLTSGTDKSVDINLKSSQDTKGDMMI